MSLILFLSEATVPGQLFRGNCFEATVSRQLDHGHKDLLKRPILDDHVSPVSCQGVSEEFEDPIPESCQGVSVED